MKSTDLERRNREIKKSRKKMMVLERKSQRDSRTAGDFINLLDEAFFYDAEKIYNINMSENILVLLEELKEDIPQKQWGPVIRKAVKKTKVKMKDEAVNMLAELAGINLDN